MSVKEFVDFDNFVPTYYKPSDDEIVNEVLHEPEEEGENRLDEEEEADSDEQFITKEQGELP